MLKWYIGPMLWMCLLLNYLTALSTDATSSGHAATSELGGLRTEQNNSNTSCTGIFTVGTEAKNMSIPMTPDGTAISCKWVLKTSHHRHKVALSLIDMGLDLGLRDYFKLQVLDGKSADARVLATLEFGNGTFLDFNVSIVEPIVSSGEYLVVEYVNRGNNPFLADFLYYTCGGMINASTYVSSPIFSVYHPVPRIVECHWHFVKPADALYGLVQLLHVNITDESVLQISTNSSMKVVEHVDKNQTTNSNGTRRAHADSKETGGIEEVLDWANDTEGLSVSRENNKPPLPASNTTIQPIFGDSIRTVVFDGHVAILSYRIGEPRLDVGFNALYFPVVVPRPRKTVPVPWYVNYSGITIYTPIGVLIGSIIIYVQLRTRRPSRSSFDALSRSFNSEPKLNAFQFSFRCERNLRFSSLRSVPENLRSFTNLKSMFANSAASRSKEKISADLPSTTTLRTSREEISSTDDYLPCVSYATQNGSVAIVFSRVEEEKDDNANTLKGRQDMRTLSKSSDNLSAQNAQDDVSILPDMRRTKSVSFGAVSEDSNANLLSSDL